MALRGETREQEAGWKAITETKLSLSWTICDNLMFFYDNHYSGSSMWSLKVPQMSPLPSLPSCFLLLRWQKRHLSLKLLSKHPITLPWKPFTSSYVPYSLSLSIYISLLSLCTTRPAVLSSTELCPCLAQTTKTSLYLRLMLIADLSSTKAGQGQ